MPSSLVFRSASVARFIWVLLATAFLSLVFLVLLLATLHKALNHDENMYVSSGVLLHSGLLPYRDYPLFQMPLLTLLYAAVIWPNSDQLLVARVVSTLCAFVTCLVLFFGALQLSRGAPGYLRAIIASGGVLLFIANPELVYASGLAWNHDLPIMLTVCSVSLLACSILHERAGPQVSAVREHLMPVASGLLLGLAASARVTFAAVVPPLVLMPLLVSPSSGPSGLADRARRCLLFCGGVLLGLLPAAFFLLNDLRSFLFGNVTYHRFNEQYWLQAGYTRAMTLDGKLAYFRDVLVGEPFNWLVLLAGALLVPALMVSRTGLRSGKSLPALLAALSALALFAAALVPAPTWLQYYYAPYVLAVFAVVLGAATLSVGQWRYPASVGLLAISLVCALRVLPAYQQLDGTLSLSDTTTAQVQATALDIRRDVPTGTVVTLAPIYALEAGRDIYPGLASGPFAPRVADLLPAGTKSAQRISSISDLVDAMQANPPEAVLVGTEGALEDHLAQFALDHRYRKVALPSGLTLWVRR